MPETKPISIDEFVKASSVAKPTPSVSTEAKPISIEEFSSALNSSRGLPETSEKPGMLKQFGEFLAPTFTRTVENISKGRGAELKDIAGSALEIGSFLVPAGAGVKAAQLGLRGLKAAPLAQKITAPAITGATSGGLAGAGRAVGEGKPLEGVISDTATGAVAGGATGGALGLTLARFGLKNPKAIIDQRAKELEAISNNYAPLRRAISFSKDAGKASRERVASTDVLVDAVDENGLLRTKQPGGAVELYRSQTIDPAEGVVRKNLQRLGERVKLSNVERQLTKAIEESGLEGDDLVSALRNVKREISGYRTKADKSDTVPLTLIHDAKVNQYKNINYQTPPEKATARKALARGLKEVVENNTSFNAKEVNAELTKYLEDINFLEGLDGKRVRGGRLGKYFSQISGNIVGGVAGHAVGGPVGSALGTIVGGELGSRVRGSLLQKTLGGKTGTVAPPNSILNEAQRMSTMKRIPVKSEPSDFIDPRNLPVIQIGRTPKTKEQKSSLPIIR